LFYQPKMAVLPWIDYSFSPYASTSSERIIVASFYNIAMLIIVHHF
jgi:hypothetical protein